MRTKSRASIARVSKVPSVPSSVIARVLNVTGNLNCADGDDLDVACTITNTESLDQPTAAKRLKVTANDDGSRDNTWVDEVQNDDEPDSTGEAMIHTDSRGLLNYLDILNWDSPATLEWTEQGLCIKCNKGGDVLFCSSRDCPLAVHEFCLSYSPSFDDMGNFYCPFCSYKQALAECEKMEKEVALAKEKAHSARVSFSVFINGQRQKQTTLSKEINPLTIAEENNSLETKTIGKQSSGALKDQQEAVDGSGSINKDSRTLKPLVNKGDGVSLSREHQANEVGSSEQRSVEDQQEAVSAMEFIDKSLASEGNGLQSGLGSPSKLVDIPQKESVIDQQEVVVAFECTNLNFGVETSSLNQRNGFSKFRGYHPKQVDRKVVENLHQAEVPVSSDDKNLEGTAVISELPLAQEERITIENFQEHRCVRDAEDRLPAEAHVESETCIDAPTTAIHADCRTQGTAEHTKSIDPPEKSSSEPCMDTVESAGNQNVKKDASSKSMKCYNSATRSSNLAIPNSRRKRLHWTSEEEEMLKEAVEKFSGNTRKNLSWRSILDFGSHVFNESRTPVDLKDKWRNMVKEQSRGKKS